MSELPTKNSQEFRQHLRTEQARERGFLYKRLVKAIEEKLTQGIFVEIDESRKEVSKKQVILTSPDRTEEIILQQITTQPSPDKTETHLTIESKITPPSIGVEQSIFRLALDPSIKDISDSEAAITGLMGRGGFTDNQIYQNLLVSIEHWGF